jgi:photosystem II stability/assembly factor-like uncharacterized protein
MKRTFLPIIIGGAILILVIFGFIAFSRSRNSTTTTNVVVRDANGFIQSVSTDSILESTDGGKSFNPKFKIITNGEVGKADVLSITFHPDKEGYILVSSANDGLFKKEKGEDAWTPIVFPPKSIYSFILDRSDPNQRMFASGVINQNGRIFRSEDGGTNWKPVYSEPGQNTVVTSLAQDTHNSNIIFAGTSVGTIIKSADGGNSWKNVGNKIEGVIKRF